MHGAPDEEGRGALDLSRRHPAGHVPADAIQLAGPASATVDERDVKPQLAGIPPQIIVFERLLALE